MEYGAFRVGHVQISDDERVVLSRQRLVSEDFTGRHLKQFSAEGSRLERCRFDGAVIGSGSFGAGRLVSEYVGCSFDRAKISMGPGGYARFVDCSFEDTLIESWFCFAVELVRCTFSGRLRKAVFNGTVPEDKRGVVGRSVNQFEANDFSRAKLVDCAFRTGIDLHGQRLPSGPEYTYLEDAAMAVRRARTIFNAWEDPEVKRDVRGVLVGIEEDVVAGQRQLLIRVDDYPRRARGSIRSLLEAALES